MATPPSPIFTPRANKDLNQRNSSKKRNSSAFGILSNTEIQSKNFEQSIYRNESIQDSPL